MAGRARRLIDYGERQASLRRPGEVAEPGYGTADVGMQALIKKINEIRVANIDPLILHDIEVLFKKICVTGESVKSVLSNLHSKALTDITFGEKLVHALEQIATLEIDNVCIRSELLTFIENDFKIKDTISQTDIQKFVNAVMLLGNVYNVIRIKGVPIEILGLALLEYTELLLKGDEEQLKVLTIQLLLNGDKILMTENLSEKYEALRCSLRKTLVNRNLSSREKCWILLALDCTEVGQKPLSGLLRDFYHETLGRDYLQLESIMKNGGRDLSTSVVFTTDKNAISNAKRYEWKSEKSNKNEELQRGVQSLRINQPSDNCPPLKLCWDDSEVRDLPAAKGKFGERREKKHESATNNSDFPESEFSDFDDNYYGIQLQRKKGTKNEERKE